MLSSSYPTPEGVIFLYHPELSSPLLAMASDSIGVPVKKALNYIEHKTDRKWGFKFPLLI
jgi:hypothetical protein